MRVVCDWGWSEERMECGNGERVVLVNGDLERERVKCEIGGESEVKEWSE